MAMKINIDWTFLLDVTTEQKSAKLTEKIAGLLSKLECVKTERYWKDKTFYRVTAKSLVDASTAKDAYYSIMQMAGHIARSWIVTVPSEEGLFEFSGAMQPGSVQIQGVNFINFDCLQVVAESTKQMATA